MRGKVCMWFEVQGVGITRLVFLGLEITVLGRKFIVRDSL